MTESGPTTVAGPDGATTDSPYLPTTGGRFDPAPTPAGNN